MHLPQRLVREFHRAMGVNNPDPGDQPVNVQHKTELRLNLIHEEFLELVDAVGARWNPMRDEWEIPDVYDRGRPDTIAAIDALGDLLYVIYGTADEWGIDLEPYFAEVHRSNMTKVGGPVRSDGKRLKPEWYTPPALHLTDDGCSLIEPNWIRDLPASDEELGVVVTLLNNDGDRLELVAFGPTTEDAVRAAEEHAREDGDDSWVQTDWKAA